MSGPEKSEAPGIRQLLTAAFGGARVATNLKDYTAHQQGSLADRQSEYVKVVNNFYDLATDFYEYGWGQCFHFAQRAEGETYGEAILRHEHRLALRLGLRPGMTVLDVGCGVGGPMRNIARLAGCSIVGINNSPYQVRRAEKLNAAAGLSGLCKVIPGDFMSMPFPDGTLDAVYAIEATVHAPSLEGVFREVLRCLRPGGLFALYDWCVTDRYDESNAEHRAIKRGIEEGNGLIDMGTSAQLPAAIEQAGFDLIEHYDAIRDGGFPWYEPLASTKLSVSGFRSSTVGRKVTNSSLRLLELLRVVPKGAADVAIFLDKTAVALVAGGRTGIFTPMYFLYARKPA
jgi:sterol 24-C-methyltransferase